MFKALVLSKERRPGHGRGPGAGRGAPARGRRHGRGRAFDPELQGRADHRRTRRRWCAASPTCRASISPAGWSRARHPDWRPGDAVVLTGWGVGERQWGGHAERARVKGDWLVPLPAGWTTRQAMAVGTAGFTAMLAVIALEQHGLEPGAGEVLVTGAAGGVGSVAIALLAKLGHRVTASTGRPASHDYLRALGASGFIDRAELAEPSLPAARIRALRRLHRQRRRHHARPRARPDAATAARSPRSVSPAAASSRPR